MGQTATRSYMCCSRRDKYIPGSPAIPFGITPQFDSLEVELLLDKLAFASFAPLHQKNEVPLTRRIALANKTEVHVYRLPESELSTVGKNTQFPLVNRLVLEEGQVVTGLMFCDEDNSRQLAVAFGPEDGKGDYIVRIWNCEDATVRSEFSAWEFLNTHRGAEKVETIEWKQNEGFAHELDGHDSRISRLAAGRTYFVTADDAGECHVCQKTRSFARRAAGQLHVGGFTDLSVDRLFVYSAGLKDRRVCVWALPDLSPVLALLVDVTLEQLSFPFEETTHAESPLSPAPPPVVANRSTCANGGDNGANRICALTLLRRPLSRWAGWQGSSRGPKAPRGVVFVAGVLSDQCEVCRGAGVLMEWSLGEKRVCNNAQVAHSAPIVVMVYGPYDNGPLVTADASGVFRVWEILLDRGLRCSQQIDLLCPPKGDITVCVEQPRALYVTCATKRLCVWQRFSESNS